MSNIFLVLLSFAITFSVHADETPEPLAYPESESPIVIDSNAMVVLRIGDTYIFNNIRTNHSAVMYLAGNRGNALALCEMNNLDYVTYTHLDLHICRIGEPCEGNDVRTVVIDSSGQIASWLVTRYALQEVVCKSR